MKYGNGSVSIPREDGGGLLAIKNCPAFDAALVVDYGNRYVTIRGASDDGFTLAASIQFLNRTIAGRIVYTSDGYLFRGNT